MTIEEGKQKILPFADQCDEDNDPYFIVHFSRKDDCYMGYHDRIDHFDALIILKEIIKEFKIDEVDLATLLNPVEA